MKDDRPRPRFNRPAIDLNNQFSLVSNLTFQFWDPVHECSKTMPAEILDHWWFQAEEPEAPEGWVVGSAWVTDRTGIRSRLLYHKDEPRRLDANQRAAVGVRL